MNYARPDALVSTDWLAARLDAPDVRIVDASVARLALPRAGSRQRDVHGLDRVQARRMDKLYQPCLRLGVSALSQILLSRWGQPLGTKSAADET